MNNKDKYIKISDFAKLCKTNRKTLIFYDNEGIFKPKFKDDKGYRYYHINQYDAFSILLELREIGVSLKEIKEYLKEKNPNNYLELLNREKKKTEEKIKKLNKIMKNVENKISTTEEGIGSLVKSEVYIETCEKSYYNFVYVESDGYKGIIKGISNLLESKEEKKIISGYPIGAVVSKKNVLDGNYEHICKMIIKVEDDIRDEFLIKEKGEYAVINHRGMFENTYKSYEKLLRFIEGKGYRVVGDSFEESLLEYLSCGNEKDFLTKISVRIEKRINVDKI